MIETFDEIKQPEIIYDTESILKSINQGETIPEKLIALQEYTYLQKTYQELRITYYKLKDLLHTNRIEVDQLSISAFQQKIAGYMVVTDARQTWFLANAILFIIKNQQINTLIKQKYGENYEKLLQELKKQYILLDVIKNFLDITDKRSINDNDLKSQTYKNYLEATTKLPLINDTYHHIFILINQHTNIGLRSIPKEYTRIYELTYKKIDLKPQEQYKQTNTTQNNNQNNNTNEGGQ